MKKSDLRSGMVVETRGGWRGLVVEFPDGLEAISNNCVLGLDYYASDLKREVDSESDIVKVYNPGVISAGQLLPGNFHSYMKSLIWERNDTKEISSEEAFRVLKEYYGCDVKIME